MSNLNISNAVVSSQRTTVGEVSVDTMTTDGAMDQNETYYQNDKWTQQWGYFNQIPDLKTALILKSIWIVGSGFVCDNGTRARVDAWTGWGKDNFEDVLFNLYLGAMIGGDSFAEIIREDNEIVNLKPLDPGSIRIVVDKKGRIKRYEQFNNVTKVPTTWEPNEIFHISHNRVADQIHGISDIDALEAKILAEYESFVDMKKIMHRQARPLIMFKLKTDDTTKINAFMAKMDQATKYGENMYIPDDENIVSYEVVQVNVSDIVLSWRDSLRNDFFRAIGLPQIVPGGGGQSTESEAKTIYLAFERIVEHWQRFIERQVSDQLGININLIAPASMQPTLETDNTKDGNLQTAQPTDMIAGRGG